ncbi:MAG: 4Fe-4S dicluster domain-containing protein [Planctomycetota bacterium]
MNRRDFLRQTATITTEAIGAGILLTLLATSKNQTSWVTPEFERRGLIRPPGSVEESDFLSRCIRCQRCSDVCESHCIKLFTPGSGKQEFTPYIVPEQKACSLCLKCGEACPTGAILPLHEKRLAKMGTAVVDEQLCVSHNGTGVCGACFTICPLRGKAITQSAHNKPTVHEEHCVGCGLCEEACIVDYDKAIRVYSQRRWS